MQASMHWHTRRGCSEYRKNKAGERRPDTFAPPGEGLLTLIKDMYQDGDADTKRAIAQAWSKVLPPSDTALVCAAT